MSMTPENATPDWRGLSDQLTPDQIATLAGYAGDKMGRAELLAVARSFADNNVVDAVLGPVVAPAGAVIVDDGWSDALTPDAFRVFYGEMWTVPVRYSNDGEVEIVVRGTQKADGRIDERGIIISGAPYDLISSDEARHIAAALIEAADEIDELAKR